MDVEMKPPPPLGSDGSPGQGQIQNGPVTVIKRRSPIACRRCRRMRSKCVHDKAKAPCQACLEAGLGVPDCIFPVRGQPDQDRDYRHPRLRAEKSNKRDPAKVRRDILDAPVLRSPALSTSSMSVTGPLSAGLKPPKGGDDWDLLPPLPEIIDAVYNFTHHYFQLGFIPKQSFPERLRTNHRSVSVFFLLGLLSVSARLTPSLIERYGSAVNASETFMEHASTVALKELYRGPSLEKCQAFYLLSIAQQGSMMKYQSSINMGISMRMATLLQLHREETYAVANKTKELIVSAESARRTIWMLHSQDNLHSGPRSPVSLVASDITALLPCNEKDFANAREPKSRAALEDTPAAIENPKLVSDDGRSLFATLIQAHYYWGAISRRAISLDRSPRPWESGSEYAQMARRLEDWERGLPNDHRWSRVLLKGYKQDREDLAYLGVTMITRLCNIVLRKIYLHEMLSYKDCLQSYEKTDPDTGRFWGAMSLELFKNVKGLFEQIDTQYSDRSPEEGMGAQMASFCVYSCGFLACYLVKYPRICPDPSLTREGPAMVQRTLSILAESTNLWPLASRWYDHLEKFYKSQTGMIVGGEGSMADSKEPIPHVLHPALTHTAIKPIKPRAAPQSPDTKDGASLQSPSTPLLPAPQQNAASVMYIDPAMRLPVPQQAQSQSTPQPPVQAQVQMPQGMPPPVHTHAHGQARPHPHPQAHVHTRPNPHGQAQMPSPPPMRSEGLEMLLEAFDIQPDGMSRPPPPNVGNTGPPQPPSGPVAVSVGPPYDPHAVSQEYYQQTALVMNDGYENELGYYMSDGVSSVMQNWVSGGNMYGY
ncbi:hypothetical protein B0H67DRAFT_559408 [Lasiosphaeris hirsuta]|uniref:Zn(2)-C6 fungal-type domain-containing protein n=1 Tax=Lasiosphaeris hirsuta TaxID=260670 RepID=A0AA40B8R5_9PEZI|nr:hypothetical protein B0H67DRAFT_559408 [Lasiosphaeris hirsuta]